MASDPRVDAVFGEALKMMQQQVLLVLIDRLGGEVSLPVPEIDGTGGWRLEMEMVPNPTDPVNPKAMSFRFKLRKPF